jgi:PAS domain S-box-containing protein
MTFNPKIFFLITVLAMTVCSASAEPPQTASQDSRCNVLIINSYHKAFRWTDNQVSGASTALSDAIENLELYIEYMDTKRIYTEEYLNHLVHNYHLKYDNIRLNAIIATDDNALRFVMDHHQDLFQNVPVSFCGINDYSSYSFADKKQFTGLIEVLDIEATIDMALQLHPETRRIYVIVDSTPTGVGQLRDVTKAAGQYPQLKFKYFKGDDYTTAELLEKLSQLPQDSIVLLTVWLRDRNDEYAATDEVGPLISNRSNVPVYGIIDMYLGHGIVGGKLLNSETHGRLAAEMTVRILNGEKPSNIPILVESLNPYMFDETQLQRWHIDPADLPKGSILINHSFSLYETYRIQIWCIVGVVVVLLTVIMLMVANITKRKQVENALRKSRRLLGATIDNSPAVIYIKDTCGRYLLLNKHYEELLDISRENAIGKKDDDLFPKELARKFQENDRTVLKSNCAQEFEEVALHSNGELRTYISNKFPLQDDNGKPYAVCGISLDITERKQAEEKILASQQQLKASNQQLSANEQQLRASNQHLRAGEQQLRASNKQLQKSEGQYRLLVEGTENFVTRVDCEGKFIFVNQTSEKIFGLKPEECIGLLAFDFVHTDDRQRTMDAFDGWIRDRSENITIENRQVSRTGEVHNMLWTCRLVFDESGQVSRIDGIAQDITDRKEAEVERERLVKTLEFKNRELQDIVYSASHDLRSPLVNIEGFSSILKTDCARVMELLAESDAAQDKTEQIELLLKEGIPESLGFITGSAKKMANLLDGLLQVSRVGSVEMECISLDMDSIITTVLAAMEHQVQESGASITVESLPACVGDVHMVDNILTNLIGNAVKYLDPAKEGQIRISGEVEDGMSVYCVQDNGVGIAAGHQDKVFEIFHRLAPEDSAGGEGLGLTIVTRILDRLGGDIRLESKEGKGSKFFVSLPAVKA